MNSSQFASFASYQPPPDAAPPPQTTSTSRPWFPVHSSSNFISGAGSNMASSASTSTSYQAGGIPTWGNAVGGGSGNQEEADGVGSEWETRFGWRVDVEAAATYLLGPVSALLILIIETHNDFVRFHAYQSAMLTTPLILLRILFSFIFPGWLLAIFTILIVGIIVFMAIRAYRDGNESGQTRYRLPYIGELADRWVGEE